MAIAKSKVADTARSWIVPVAVQAVVPVIIASCAIFIRKSSLVGRLLNCVADHRPALGPRWLLSKRRKDDAIETLRKIRPKQDVGMYTLDRQKLWLIEVAAGLHMAEIDAIEEALRNKMDKGPWLDLFVRCAC